MLNEKKVLDELTRRRLPCQHRVQIGHFEVDILVGCKIAVEVDGYYHALTDKVALDASKDKHLESLGYAVLRITAGEVKNKRRLREFGARVERYYQDECQRRRREPDAPLTAGVPQEELQQLKAKLEQEERDPQEPEVNQERELSEEELFLQAIEDLSKRSKD